MVGVIISLLVTIMVVVILLKKMKAQFVLFFGGLTLLVCSIAMDAFGLLPNGAQILPKGVASTGFIGFDLFNRTRTSERLGLNACRVLKATHSCAHQQCSPFWRHFYSARHEPPRPKRAFRRTRPSPSRHPRRS